MSIMATDRFQGLCLVKEDGAGIAYIRYYDMMPPAIRERVRNSPINLCAACISQDAKQKAFARDEHYPRISDYLCIISHMEQMVLGENTDGISRHDQEIKGRRVTR